MNTPWWSTTLNPKSFLLIIEPCLVSLNRIGLTRVSSISPVQFKNSLLFQTFELWANKFDQINVRCNKNCIITYDAFGTISHECTEHGHIVMYKMKVRKALCKAQFWQTLSSNVNFNYRSWITCDYGSQVLSTPPK